MNEGKLKSHEVRFVSVIMKVNSKAKKTLACVPLSTLGLPWIHCFSIAHIRTPHGWRMRPCLNPQTLQKHHFNSCSPLGPILNKAEPQKIARHTNTFNFEWCNPSPFWFPGGGIIYFIRVYIHLRRQLKLNNQQDATLEWFKEIMYSQIYKWARQTCCKYTLPREWRPPVAWRSMHYRDSNTWGSFLPKLAAVLKILGICWKIVLHLQLPHWPIPTRKWHQLPPAHHNTSRLVTIHCHKIFLTEVK